MRGKQRWSKEIKGKVGGEDNEAGEMRKGGAEKGEREEEYEKEEERIKEEAPRLASDKIDFRDQTAKIR